MAFFKTPEQFEGGPDTEAPSDRAAGQPPGKPMPLFRQETSLPDDPAAQHLSLSDYISRHLSDPHPANPQAPQDSQSPPQTAMVSPWVSSHPRKPPLEGWKLNTIDGDLTAGLEQYLPTPLFRLRVMKKRLDDEIAELQARLNKYARLPEKSPDMQSRMQALEARLEMLKAHEQTVSQELSTLLALGGIRQGLGRPAMPPWLAGLSGGLTSLVDWLWSGVCGWFYGPAFGQLQTDHAELENLQALMAERMRDPTVADGEISHLLNQYERITRRMETAALQLNARPWPARLWQDGLPLVE